MRVYPPSAPTVIRTPYASTIYTGTAVSISTDCQREKPPDNISSCPKGCLEISEFTKIMDDDIDTPCNADAEYESVVVRRDAEIISYMSEKELIPGLIIDKDVLKISGFALPENMVKGTAVDKITPKNITGKYQK